MADPKLPGDVAGPDTLMSKFHYPLTDYIREWPSIHKNPPKLIHSSMSMHGCKRVVLTVYFHRGAPDCRPARAAASRRQGAAQSS